MRIKEQRLCIGIRDDTYTGITRKIIELVFELRSEGGMLNGVNHPAKTILLRKRSHTSTTGAKMTMVVRAVKNICYTRRFTY